MIKKPILFLLTIVLLSSCSGPVNEPEPVYPIPLKKQLEWQRMEYYGFLHFNMNTFTDQEWGFGDTDPSVFNPTELDARQWARVAREAGMKGLILTAKHHDGFCLWPSAYTEYSVKNSPWRDGKGDVVKELADACEEYGLKLGIYLSPWDRNHPEYGTAAYITYFRNQLTELLSNYGEVFEVWFDGANGGDGYYGGANETRRVDKKTYYDWENTRKIIDSLQPNAVGFSDAGPHVRWVGNEQGYAYETTWSPLLRDSVYGGMPEYHTQYAMGQENGTHWVPAEADVSIRPGWYYHQSEDHQVKSLNHLLDIYYRSVGQNATLLLNLPIDRRGLVHENDERQLKKLTRQLELDFAHDLTEGAEISASETRQNAKHFAPANCLDDDQDTYWATDDGVINAALILEFDEPTEFNRIELQEYIALGQRVKSFSVAVEKEGKWEEIAKHTTIGYKRILRLPEITASRVKIQIDDARACPLISEIAVYNAPPVIDQPVIQRSKDGMVTIGAPDDRVTVHYTVDGTTPNEESEVYSTPFLAAEPTLVQAYSLDTESGRKSEIQRKHFDVSKKAWKLISKNEIENPDFAIDDNPNSQIRFGSGPGSHELIIDLGEETALMGFTYTPDQRRWKSGIVSHYACYGSNNNENWTKLAEGNFANIGANAIQQRVLFERPFSSKLLKFVSTRRTGDEKHSTLAEFGVITTTME
jgi:alpha-L-fucosidase